MKGIFLDTNIVVDLLAGREGAFSCARILSDAKKKSIVVYVSVLTMVNIAYILRKTLKGENFYDALEKLGRYVNVCGETADDYKAALQMRSDDFEDAVQYQCAFRNNVDLIITNNLKDFVFSEIAVVKPDEAISLIENL